VIKQSFGCAMVA